jgi:two-component system, response regulator PdtaR
MMPDDVLSSKRVVVCEDDAITVLQLERGLTRAGLIVCGKTGDGREAVEIVLREKPDIVLMDVGLRGPSGLDAAGEILAQFQTCVVMLTGSSDPEHMERAAALGAAGYILKPITAELLLPALRHALTMFFDCRP